MGLMVRARGFVRGVTTVGGSTKRHQRSEAGLISTLPCRSSFVRRSGSSTAQDTMVRLRTHGVAQVETNSQNVDELRTRRRCQHDPHERPTEGTGHVRAAHGRGRGFLAAYAIPILRPDLDHRLLVICEAVTWGTWLLFAADYFCRFGLANDRNRYFVHHILDFRDHPPAAAAGHSACSAWSRC